MVILGNIFIIKISYAKIKNDGKNEGQIKNGIINSVTGSTNSILDSSIDSQNIDGLDEQIQK